MEEGCLPERGRRSGAGSSFLAAPVGMSLRVMVCCASEGAAPGAVGCLPPVSPGCGRAGATSTDTATMAGSANNVVLREKGRPSGKDGAGDGGMLRGRGCAFHRRRKSRQARRPADGRSADLQMTARPGRGGDMCYGGKQGRGTLRPENRRGEPMTASVPRVCTARLLLTATGALALSMAPNANATVISYGTWMTGPN